MSELSWWVQQGDSVEVLKTLPTASVDALVTDPPAGIGFMGKEWDGHKGGRDKWIAWLRDILVECRRVMKPGAYGWMWALPRTSHWTATACEDAGFAVRDVLVHVFGTGFPKSRSLLKPAQEMWISIQAPQSIDSLIWSLHRALDALTLHLCPNQKIDSFAATVTPQLNKERSGFWSIASSWKSTLDACCYAQSTFTTETASSQITLLKTLNYSLSQITPESIIQGQQNGSLSPVSVVAALFSVLQASLPNIQTPFAVENAIEKAAFNEASASELQTGESEQKTGPGSEHWILIKAPGNLRELRIEENRIGIAAADLAEMTGRSGASTPNQVYGSRIGQAGIWSPNHAGRWPANFALNHDDDCKPSGTRKVKTSDPRRADGSVNCGLGTTGIYGGVADPDAKMDKPRYCDADGTETVEVWQCAEGCPVKMLDEQSGDRPSGSGNKNKKNHSDNAVFGKGLGKGVGEGAGGDSGGASRFFYTAKPSTRERSVGMPEGSRNVHTTVKSIALMRHLVSLIAAPGDLVLDPFTGSGTTGIAALKQGCRFVGIEQSEEYCEIARRRIAHHAATIPAYELVVDAAGVPGHDASAHHADHGLPEHEQPAAGLPAQRAEGEPAAAGAGGAVDARE